MKRHLATPPENLCRFALLLIGVTIGAAQTTNVVAAGKPSAIVPSLEAIHDTTVWRIVNRRAALHREAGRTFARLESGTGAGTAWLVGSDFHEGTIEVDLRGRNLPGESFVGIRFRGVDDKTADEVYFRPFNFQNPERRDHSVQYASSPDLPWSKLRAEKPGVYEAAIDPPPGPEDWFHVRLVIENRVISAFVNDRSKAALTIKELTGRMGGMVGLSGANADFANLRIVPKGR